MKISDKALAKLLTKQEKERLQKRFEILMLLKKGVGVREVAKQKKTSSATIVKLKKRFLPHLFQKEKSVRGKVTKKELPWRLG